MSVESVFVSVNKRCVSLEDDTTRGVATYEHDYTPVTTLGLGYDGLSTCGVK